MTDTLTPEQARQHLADAEDERAEAQQLADTLAERVRDGDDTVKPGDLSAARDLADFAELRIAAAQRKRDQAEDADRDARARQVAAEARALAEQDDPADLAAAVRAVAEAVATLDRLARARCDRFSGMGQRLAAVGDELRRTGIDPLEMRARYGVRGDRETVIVYGDERLQVRSVRPGTLLAAAVAAALSDEALYDVQQGMPSARANAQQAAEAVPALAGALQP